MKAVVVHEINKFSVEDVTLDPPKAGEVKIKMRATGVCHSDLSVINGTIPLPLPAVIGHEGAGIVEEVGEGVTNVKPGDHVTMSFVPNCGECFHCLRNEGHLCMKGSGGRMLDGTSRVKFKGEEINVMTLLGNMAEYVVCPSISVVPIDKEIPFSAAALIGCGVTTGVGAALWTAEVKPGSTVAVFGCGGVGLSIIQGARIAGAAVIVAIDLADNKLEMAKQFGATHTFNANADVGSEIRALTEDRGVDYAFEAIGVPKVIEAAYNVTRPGGMTVVVGVGKITESVSLNALLLSLQGKTIKGCMYGSVQVPVGFPELLRLYQAGKLDLDAMVTETYTIDQAPQAFADMESGKNARGVILFD